MSIRQAKTESWLNLFSKLKLFLACLFLNLILYQISNTIYVWMYVLIMNSHSIVAWMWTKSFLEIKRSLSDCNATQTHNDLVFKRTINHLAKLVRVSLAKWLSVHLLTKWLWDRFLLQAQFIFVCSSLTWN